MALPHWRYLDCRRWVLFVPKGLSKIAQGTVPGTLGYGIARLFRSLKGNSKGTLSQQYSSPSGKEVPSGHWALAKIHCRVNSGIRLFTLYH